MDTPTPDTPNLDPLPWQRSWIDDSADVRVWDADRRLGSTWGVVMDAARIAEARARAARIEAELADAAELIDLDRDALVDVSRATVKWHLHNLYTKTGTANDAGLLRLLLDTR